MPSSLAEHLLNLCGLGKTEGEGGQALGYGVRIQWRTRPIGGGALGKLDSVWDHGVFLGVKWKTGGNRDWGEIRNLQSEDCQEEVDRGS